MLRAKALFFAAYTSICGGPSFLAVFLRGAGVSPAQIGLLLGVGPFISAGASAALTLEADKRRARKRFLILCADALALAIAHCAQRRAGFCRRFSGALDIRFSSQTRDSPQALGAFSTLHGHFALVLAASLAQSIFGSVVGPLMDSSAIAMLTAEAKLRSPLPAPGGEPAPDEVAARKYSRQRLFGTLSCCLATSFVGAVCHARGSLLPVFPLAALFSVVCALVVFLVVPGDADPRAAAAAQADRLIAERAAAEAAKGGTPPEGADAGTAPSPAPVSKEEEASKLPSPRSPRPAAVNVPEGKGEKAAAPGASPLWSLALNPAFLTFLVFGFLNGAGRSVSGQYLFLYLTERQKASSLLLGLTAPFSVALEAGRPPARPPPRGPSSSHQVACFAAGPMLLEWLGPPPLLLLSQFALALRCTVYAVLPGAPDTAAAAAEAWPWEHTVVLLAELLQGLSFALFWIAGVHMAASVAPAGLEAASQGVFQASSGALASGVAGFLGGALYQRSGPLAVYRWAAVSSFAVLGALAVQQAALRVAVGGLVKRQK
eukprot:tig00000402_g249.t1